MPEETARFRLTAQQSGSFEIEGVILTLPKTATPEQLRLMVSSGVEQDYDNLIIERLPDA